jgi:hypothetical protein
MISYSKAQLLDMNSHIKYGFNWIKNIENINDTAYLFSTGDIAVSGRIYIALPENTVITPEIKKKYNIID